MKSLATFFKLDELSTNFKTEIIAGATTFLTMAYIIFVNPGILSAAGVPFPAAATATAVGAAIMSILMGTITNRPLALASGMGLNAVLAFSVIGVAQSKIPWQVGMSVIFAEGFLIFILVMTGLREAVMNAIPLTLKRAIGVGIGLFITVIGLNEGGIIRPAPITLVSLGDLSSKHTWVTLIGLMAIFAFMALRIKGSILWGIIVATLAAIVLQVVQLPSSIIGAPDFSAFFAPFQKVNGSIALTQIFTPVLLVAIFSIMLTDFFDTMGTVVAVGEQAGFVDKNGKVPGIKRILMIDSLAAVLGGLFGASSITTYIESASGVAEGGRSGLMSVVCGVLFFMAAFFSPIIAMIGGGYVIDNGQQYTLLVQSGFIAPTGSYYLYPITAAALIVVGFFMMQVVRDIEWNKFDEAFPAFLTIVGIPLTYNISHGIGMGFISYTIIKLFHGKKSEIHPLMYGVSFAFLLAFALQ
ncbi:MAG: hypothetical protein A2504_13470 [Bdellovibrionales bacterium RIFOXYD12_FULL_39_22]|nr:MAG: hypothetical protein A2385_01270 [Bdellovibrionales bacterium RIFOXYB1_FULL_39_21]OFZ43636.1 MAG: hypothetical protein A2485_12940 [Bdellovibrionales bacterium RIFOXYC12_FULL_39_17]OFZ44655.1 MAG: hypothetical protein A2404_10630 [Bdellovibrionales bacterium RIFOXYC1_FULL_39_130]OFZ76414.1 MAG: hypothetical protein A2560_07250 [Bdellovibrionales bacterium RIFOXYD1_FULL_39_84]OFZ94680.1 MAG: hypothetical protein A2504_13470 [Bdellovibrionales bacterium RIFOXYD12_FULL_39_22]HLE12862.1 NC